MDYHIRIYLEDKDAKKLFNNSLNQQKRSKFIMDNDDSVEYSEHWIKYGSYMKNETSYSIEYDIDQINVWPSKSEIKCWHCCRNFDTRPIGLPRKIRQSRKFKDKIIFYLKGCFCSFSCAKIYNYQREPAGVWEKQESLLNLYYRKSGNRGMIHESPIKEVLIDFGGSIPSSKYDKIINEKKIVRYDFPPSVSQFPTITVDELKINDNVNYI